MTYQYLLVSSSEAVATITVNRPDKLNALNDGVLAELGSAVQALLAEGSVRGIILTGTGRAFVAGADISELSSQSAAAGKARAEAGMRVFDLIEGSPKPVIAAVNGFALGGGCELAMACHIRVAAASAQFGQPEVKLGITPGFGGSQRLPRLVGRAVALELLLSGDRIPAAEAHRLGLVNRVVADEALMDEAHALMRRILANAPLALASVLELVNRGAGIPMAEAQAMEAAHFGLLSATADMKEGMAAFLAKRSPEFRGE